MHFSIRAKMLLAFLSVIAVMWVIVGVGLNGLSSLIRTYGDEALRISTTAQLSERVQRLMEYQVRSLYGFLATGNVTYQTSFNQATNAVQEAIQDRKSVV